MSHKQYTTFVALSTAFFLRKQILGQSLFTISGPGRSSFSSKTEHLPRIDPGARRYTGEDGLIVPACKHWRTICSLHKRNKEKIWIRQKNRAGTESNGPSP